MSTTKLPEAFEPKTYNNFRSRMLTLSDATNIAVGYNAALEATGARELWEAAKNAWHVLHEELSSLEVGDSEIGQQHYVDEVAALKIINAMGMIEAALSKSNPSNTVG